MNGPLIEPPGPTRPTLAVSTSVALIVAGLSLTIYALTAFTVRDWTVAGPGLAVAVAGVAGLRIRWLFLAGVVPIAGLLTVAGPIAAFDLHRPGETTYFIGSAIIVASACAAAVLGVASAFVPHHRRTATVAMSAGVIITAAAIFAVILFGHASSDATDAGITDAERTQAVDVRMVEYGYVVTGDVRAGSVLHLRNTGTLPHVLDITSIGLDVFVPSGRDTYLRLPVTNATALTVICTVGDHLQHGMTLELAIDNAVPMP